MAEGYEDVPVFRNGVECNGFQCERCRAIYPQPMMAELCCLTPAELKVQIEDEYGEETVTKWRGKIAAFHRNQN